MNRTIKKLKTVPDSSREADIYQISFDRSDGIAIFAILKTIAYGRESKYRIQK